MARANSKSSPKRASADSVIPKSILAKEIASILEDQNLTQTEAAYIMRDAPSQISLVVTGKLRGFFDGAPPSHVSATGAEISTS